VDSSQIKQIVDAAYDGVDKSKVGPMFAYPDTTDISELVNNRQMNQIAFGTFTIVLTGMMRMGSDNYKDGKCIVGEK
jgi:hypothetical protein